MRKPMRNAGIVTAVIGSFAIGGLGLTGAAAQNNDDDNGNAPLTGQVLAVEDDTDQELDADLDELVTDRDTELAAVRELLKEATSAIAAIRGQVMDEARTEARETARTEAQKIAAAEVAKIRAEFQSELTEIRKELADAKAAQPVTDVNDDAQEQLAAARAEWQKQRAAAIAAFRQQVKDFIAARAEAREQAKTQAEQARAEAKKAREAARAQQVNFSREDFRDHAKEKWNKGHGDNDNRHDGRHSVRYDGRGWGR